MSVSRSGAVFTYTYSSALAAGTYAVSVQLHGAQDMGFSGNTTMPVIVVLTSTNTAFTFEFVNLSGGAALTPTGTSITIDFQTITQSL